MCFDESGWSKILQESGFTEVERAIRDSETALHVAHQISVMSCSSSQEVSFAYNKAVLVCPNTPSEGVSQLLENLSKHLVGIGIIVEQTTCDSLLDISDKALISFLEIDEAVLADTRETLSELYRS